MIGSQLVHRSDFSDIYTCIDDRKYAHRLMETDSYLTQVQELSKTSSPINEIYLVRSYQLDKHF